MLNRRLADRAYLAGDYSIADMASYPWIVPYERQGQNLEDFPHVKRWFEAIRARPAVERAYAKAKEINPNLGGIRTAEERAILFGQTAASVDAAVREAHHVSRARCSTQCCCAGPGPRYSLQQPVSRISGAPRPGHVRVAYVPRPHRPQ